MTNSPVDLALSHVLDGEASKKSRGFLFGLPKGYRITERVDSHLERLYGTTQHPDIRRIAPGGAGRMITIDAIRDAAPFLASSPNGPLMKTLVITSADSLNEAAANALLKPLEEPNRNTRIILFSDRPGTLLPTTRSRCMTINIPFDETDAKREITAIARTHDADIAPEKTDHLLDLADGNPALAVAIETQGLAEWIRGLPKWLANPETSGPNQQLPKALGTKSGPDLETVTLALQSFLLHASRGNCPDLPDEWSQDRCQRACLGMMTYMTDIDRAGIDAKTRLRVIMDAIAGTPRIFPS